jgi:hypothetical protein
MHRALPPFEPPDGKHPRCLRLAAVGGARPCGGWRLSAIARLQGFSSGSPAAFPHQWSPRMVTTSSMVGRSKSGCGLCPALSFKDLHHSFWVGGRGEPGPAFAWDGDPLLPPASGGGNHPPALWRRRPPAMRGKANCCCLARVQHSVLRPGDCGRLHRGVAQHVVRRESGTRVLRWSRSRSCGEDRSEELPVLAGAVLVGRWLPSSVLRCGSQRRFLRRRDRRCHLRSDLRLFGLGGLSSPLVWGRGRGTSCSSVCPEAVAVAVLPSETEVVDAAAVVGGEPPGVCRPAGPPMWRLFIPVGVEPKFRL